MNPYTMVILTKALNDNNPTGFFHAISRTQRKIDVEYLFYQVNPKTKSI